MKFVESVALNVNLSVWKKELHIYLQKHSNRARMTQKGRSKHGTHVSVSRRYVFFTMRVKLSFVNGST